MLKTQLKEKLKLSEDTDLVDDVIETPADAEAVVTATEEPTEEVKNNAIYNIVSTELRDTLSDIENLKGIIANIDDETEHADEIAETVNTIIDERSVHVGMLETLLEKIDGKPAETDTTEDEYTSDSDPHSDLVDENLTEAKDRYKIEYWVDEDARDQGLGDIAIETFDDLEDAKEYADKLFGEVASVEVLDTQDEDKVVYGRYPEEESLDEDKRLNYRNFYDRMKIKREQEKKAKAEKEKKTEKLDYDDGPEHGYASVYDYESAQKILDQMADLRNKEAEKEHEIINAWAVQKTMSDDEFHKQMKELHETTQAKEDELLKELTSLTDKAKNESVITEERLDDTEGDYTVEVYDIVYQEEDDDNQLINKNYDDKVTVTVHCEEGEEDLEYGDVIEPAVEKAIGIWPWKYKYNIISRPEVVIPDGFVRFEGYATEVGDIGRELITRTGEHIWVTDVTEDDYGFWASDDKSDIKTGRGHYYPSDRIKFVAEE